ncbi:MAG: LicD family protein [Bacillota bacterium]
MNELQKRLYKLLTEVDDVCKDNDISYYLFAGCALGAIRQGRFIDWDDDVDVVLTRDNWEKLRSVLEKECPENRKLIHKDNTPYYRNTVARYVDLDTLHLRKSMMICPEVNSVAVEVFILDPLPKDEAARKEHIESMKLYSELLNPYTVLNSGHSETEIDFDYDLYEHYRDLIREQGEETVLKRLEDKFTATADEDCDTYCMRWGRIPYLFTKELLGGGRTEMFEDRLFPVMQFSERSFRTGYGNGWMYLPEASSQWMHDAIVDLDYDNTGRYALSEEEKKELFADYSAKKEIAVEQIRIARERDRRFAGLQAEVVSRRLRKEGGEKGAFADYCELIDSPHVKGHGVQVELPGDVFFAAMMNLIMQGKYYSIPAYVADRFGGLSKGEYRKELEERYAFCRDLSAAVYDERDAEQASEILESRGDFADMPDYHRGRLWVMCRNAEKDGNYAGVISEADAAIERFGEDGEILCYKAEAMYCLGDESGAKELYEKGTAGTRNAFLLNRAETLCGVKKTEDDLSGEGGECSAAGRLLLDFSSYCEDKGISFYLVGKEDDGPLLRDSYVEIAMTRDDLNRLAEALQTDEKEGKCRYSAEQDESPGGAQYGRIRLYDKETCLIDIRDFDGHDEHGVFLSIYEIEDFGKKRQRELYEIARNVWTEGGTGRYSRKRRAVRAAAGCAKLFGAALSDQKKKSMLKNYRQRHFSIGSENLTAKNRRFKVGKNTISSLAFAEDCRAAAGDISIPALSGSRHTAADARIYKAKDLRYQIIDSNRPYSDVIINGDESAIRECVDCQKKIDGLGEKMAAATRTLDSSWKELKKTIRKD